MTTTKGPTRRALMRGAAFAGAGTILPATTLARSVPKYGETEYRYEVSRSDAEWQALLDEHEYNILREGGTEFPQSDPKWNDYADGTFTCRGCDLPLYDAGAKYDSGTGWPSFFESLPDAVGTRTDRRYVFQVRTEVHCRRCGGHLGHIFDDGPEPTGKRHCLNGLSLVFVAAG